MLSAILALLLGFGYQWLVVAPRLRDSTFADTLMSALTKSLVLFVFIAVASSASALAFRMRAGLVGKLAGATISGTLVAGAAWLTLLSLGKFHIIAGVTAGVALLALLLLSPGLAANRERGVSDDLLHS